ncbi:MAG: cation-translocating P-type ATPase [Ruminococcaceae bacterium]|nr:cation-translocating P-type ATPase [Oscillospiraceae bacterium]
MDNKYYLKSIKDLSEILGTDINSGLSISEAELRLKKYGKNIIESGKKRGIIYKFFSQFKDVMIIILLISAFISFALNAYSGEGNSDAFIILSIVIINAVIGTIQEYKAEKAIEALKKLTPRKATVIRNGRKTEIDAENIVKGDLIVLKSGDVCPCDIRLTKTVELYSEESSLTGEADAVYKSENYVGKETDSLSQRKNTVFSGSNIVSGHAIGIAVNTGMETEIGKIAAMLKKEDAPETPLSRKLNYTGKILSMLIIGICAVIFVLGIIRNYNAINMLMLSISLAVAAIPEGLTAVVTIVLSLGVKRMAKKKAIVRKPLAVETLGSTTVICTDKTGTLTENKMTVTKICDAVNYLEKNEDKKNILLLASLCNDSEISPEGKVKGTPTEKAITEAYLKENYKLNKTYKRIGEIPFTSKRKMMTTVHNFDEKYLVVSKGNPSVILNKCLYFEEKGKIKNLGTEALRKIENKNKEMANSALRVIAVAKKITDNINVNDASIESGLIFMGLIGMEDPPRKEVKAAVKACKNAGIKPIMITGDQPLTALEIAKRTGIYDEKSGSKLMTGAELCRLNEKELSKIIDEYSVFSQVSPEDKMKIVKAYEIKGEVVAMTGDGVNDAPALKAADIGCAMGRNGTEVAKSAADMILTDDNFATIYAAVKEGRTIFQNIRKTIHFLISSNIGEILVIFTSFILSMPVPLLPTQLLFVNLITDSFPALALGAGKTDEENMKKEFLSKNKDVLSLSMWFSIFIEGAFIGALSLLAFIIGRNYFDSNPYEPIIGRTMAFLVLSISQLVHSFNVASEKSIFSKKRVKNKSLFKSNLVCAALMVLVVTVPALSCLFSAVALDLHSWAVVIILSLCPLIVGETEKLIMK